MVESERLLTTVVEINTHKHVFKHGPRIQSGGHRSFFLLLLIATILPFHYMPKGKTLFLF